MFCNQCEQTAKGTGCTAIGVCGKQPDVAALQDLLIHACQGLSVVAHECAQKGVQDKDTDIFLFKAVFSTLTNVNFDPERFVPLIRKAVELRECMKARLAPLGLTVPALDAVTFAPAADLAGLVAQGELHAINAVDKNPDIQSLKQTVIYGIKGVAAYADHAALLGQYDATIAAYIYKGLASALRTDLDLGAWVALAMECGKANLTAMQILDAGNTGAYGHPVPTSVPLGHRKGKCILVSGHDLRDLETLLKQTDGKGIDIYTHGEMLPTHGYPKLKAYKHFFGHYGTAWQNQIKEFAAFPGAILMTTNCIQKPTMAYLPNIFTTGLVGWPGAVHVGNEDFSAVIKRALELPGFTDDVEGVSVNVGFGHNTVMSVAPAVIEAVKAGKIRHFFLVGGCDGAKPGRNYYTEFVEKTPKDTVILTLACGKFRFFDQQLGDIGGIPRLLDIGQCNDAYSAIQIAVALAGAFNCGVNELPLSMILSWYEQKAVAILLTLLSLGIKNIRLGPSLPAFITPNVLAFLVENFGIKAITTPDEDLKAILG
ncbi:MAG: hydroxylamine reductase [Deltaproteobacteria bacterium HGW-Deltaproteobacteria-8]|jgi:hydroxylamine reductase|nr:MAG: hydroxylamine reductase [Deltaproteobacteria bacterium HGW-Deltaproteobacteria-8]